MKSSNAPTPLTFGSLFAGIGGIDLGLERAGMQCAWQVEIDDYASKVLTKHWPNVPRFRDVRDCGAHNLAAVDLIAGGFPCQDISYAGRGAGLGGERSGLWFEFARIIGELRPRYVFVENVAALLTRGLSDILGTLASFGYDAEWHCIPAAYVGAPHIRDRVFILAYADRAEWWAQPQGGHILNRADAGREETPGGPTARGANGRAADVADAYGSHENRRGRTMQVGRIGSAAALAAARERNRTQWSAEPAVGRVAYGVPHRLDRLIGIGNAVVPQVAEFIGRLIVEHERQ